MIETHKRRVTETPKKDYGRHKKRSEGDTLKEEGETQKKREKDLEKA